MNVDPIHPQRSAHRSLYGYLYQIALGVRRWLSLRDDEVLLCEGDEDLDRIVRGGDGATDRICEQVKAYSNSITMAQEPIRDMVGWFVATFAARRQRGDRARFVFTTTADLGLQKTRRHGLELDVLAQWESDERRSEVITSLRAIAAQHGDAVAWMDAASGRWDEFIGSVEWTFGAPDLDAALRDIQQAVAVHELTAHLPAETFAQRLLAELCKAATHDEPGLRVRTRADLEACASATRRDLLRDLAETNPDGFRPHLATGLNNLGDCACSSGDDQGAKAVYREAVYVLGPCFMRYPETRAFRMVSMVEVYRATCDRLGASADEGLLAPIERLLRQAE